MLRQSVLSHHETMFLMFDTHTSMRTLAAASAHTFNSHHGCLLKNCE
jgi:hypothetical protein